MDGLLLVNKPRGISSFDVIRQLRYQLSDISYQKQESDIRYPIPGKLKIGHTGTLDPMATGLMLLLFGPATEKAGRFSKLDKVYEAEITLGFTSSTGDAEGKLNKISDLVPTRNSVLGTLNSFIGQIDQTPPQFSAVKVGGQRAYKLARKGQKVKIPSRKTTVHWIRDTGYDYPKVVFSTKVSSGTYIRSLAQDIGQKLGTGAYLSALKRTQIGDFKLASAIELDASPTVILNSIQDL